jgi:hypothetical protein
MRTTLKVAMVITAFAAVSAPLSAQSSGGKAGRNSGVYDRNGDGVIDSRDQVGTECRWYDVNCKVDSRTNGSTVDGSWQVIGRDNSGNTIYERRRVEGNGNVVVERARRDSNGRLVVVNRQIVNRNVNNNVVYGPNGETCKYTQNKNGYKKECKYNKANRNGGKNGTYNNRGEGPSYDQGAGDGNGDGKYKHGKGR